MPSNYDPALQTDPFYGAMGVSENWYGGNASDIAGQKYQNQYFDPKNSPLDSYGRGTPGGGYNSNTDQLWNLALQGQNGPNAMIDYNMGQYQEGPEWGGQAGGDQRNLQFGYGGQMTKYNQLPQFQAASQQIDEQTAAEMAKIKEEFGDAGMRMSTPLMNQMGLTSRQAAQDKNKLYLDMDREETQKAWERQMEESQRMYGRGRDIEQEGYNRWNTEDKSDYDRWMGQQQLGWDIARGKGDLQNRQWDSRFNNAMQLDNSLYGRANSQEQEFWNRTNQVDDKMWNRWQYGDQRDYDRWNQGQDRDLRAQDTDYNRWWMQQQNQQDMMKWGMGQDAAAGAGEDAWYDDYIKQLTGQGQWDTQQQQQMIAQQMQEYYNQQNQMWQMLMQMGGVAGGVPVQVNNNTPWYQNPGLWGVAGSALGGWFGGR
jgi:hypothetical protein